jgi:hypothetical protein
LNFLPSYCAFSSSRHGSVKSTPDDGHHRR